RWRVWAVVTVLLAGGTLAAAVQEAQSRRPVSLRVWEGREAEYEAFITTAPFERIEAVPVGVTHPRRAFFKPGGLVESVAWKVLPTGMASGTWESSRSEIAAYRMDRLLQLGMVPVAVERQRALPR